MSEPTPDPTLGPAPVPPQAEAIYTGPAPTEDEKSSAAISHYLNVIWIVPLILYLTKKDTSAFVKYEAGKSLNFSLTCLIAHVVFAVTACLVVPAFLSLALFVAQIVLGVMQGNKLKRGEATKYPWAINFIK